MIRLDRGVFDSKAQSPRRCATNMPMLSDGIEELRRLCRSQEDSARLRPRDRPAPTATALCSVPLVDHDQLREGQHQPTHEVGERAERGVDLAALDSADVVAVQSGSEAKPLL